MGKDFRMRQKESKLASLLRNDDKYQILHMLAFSNSDSEDKGGTCLGYGFGSLKGEIGSEMPTPATCIVLSI